MLKKNLFKAIISDLIELLNYAPMKDPNQNIIFSESYMAFKKRDISGYSIVALIDGDTMSLSGIEGLINHNEEWMKNFSKVNPYLNARIINIFLFSKQPDNDKSEVLKKEKNSISNFIVEIEKRRASVYPLHTHNIDDISLIIKNRLDSNIEDLEDTPDLNELIYSRVPEKKIEESTTSNPATHFFIIINIVIWLMGRLLELMFGYDYIVAFGVKFSPYIVAGQYWRLITPMFLHGDFMHLATNSLSLLILGRVVERIFGTAKFIIIYIISGVIGNIVSFAFSDTLSLGASGAVLGIGGALIYVWHRSRRNFLEFDGQYMTLVFLVFFNVFYGFLRPGIDNFAHLGGVISGYFTAGMVRWKSAGTGLKHSLLFAAIILALGGIGLAIGFR